MVQLTYPGVYIREVPSGVRTITGVATSVAAFVGMAKNGVLNEPTLVLGFRDYARTFSEDTSQGEMTDQVRQFFLNGGSQAYIVRIAGGNVAASSVALSNGSGTTLRLTARSAGLFGDSLRADVDYNTSSPESTFNLTVFRERVDASGNVTVTDTETFSNVTMDPSGTRYVASVLDVDSVLVKGTVTPASRNASYSISSVTAASEAALQAAVIAAFPLAPAVAKLRIRVGTVSGVVSINQSNTGTDPTTVFGKLETHLETSLGVPAGTLTISAIQLGGTGGPFALSIVAAFPGPPAVPVDVAIERAPDLDAAAKLGLGIAQGGIERGVYADARPRTNGLVSAPGNAALDKLSAFALTSKADWRTGPADTAVITLTGPDPFTVLPGDISFPDNTGNLLSGTATTAPSLLNLAENLDAFAKAINSRTTAWKATRVGYRIALRKTAGPASAGGGHVLSVAASPTELVALSAMFPSASTTVGSLFTKGDDGSLPDLAQYTDAFDALDEKVDIFNILMLPRSAEDIAVPGARLKFWGDASAFAERRRAFLLLDAQNGVDSVIKAQDAVVALRVGIVKDHCALYWPRLRINPDNRSRFIDASGTIAGIMSRTDSARGVWKAPAGLEADLRAVLGVEVPMSDPQNGLLNPRALNAIRVFTNGIVSWGARTMNGSDDSTDTDFKYVPVRRFTLFLEESLLRGLKFAVFEPNDEPLWAQIRLAAGAFMNNLFRLGAFAGRTSRDSYFVKCDSETTQPNDINLGIVNVIVGFAPLKPAEFIVITIQQKAGQVQV